MRATCCAQFSLKKSSYDAKSGAIVHRSKLHATLKRNLQVIPGLQLLQRLCKHVPDRHEHMVRYDGRYSSRRRGAERGRAEIERPDAETTSQAQQAAKAAWP